MSIRERILQLESEGRLSRYLPQRTGFSPKRLLFMSTVFREKLEDPNSAINLLVGRGEIEAVLTAWTLGEYLFDNGRGGAGFIKDLKPPPPEIWEIRVTNPSPQVRIFGRFAEPDNLVVVDMYTRGLLGKAGSRAWKSACDNCKADWESMFLDFEPYSGSKGLVSEYITENCDEFPLQQ